MRTRFSNYAPKTRCHVSYMASPRAESLSSNYQARRQSKARAEPWSCHVTPSSTSMVAAGLASSALASVGSAGIAPAFGDPAGLLGDPGFEFWAALVSDSGSEL